MNTINKSTLTEICTLVGHLARKVARKDRVIEKLKSEARWWRNAQSMTESQLKHCERVKEDFRKVKDSAFEHWKELEEEKDIMKRELGLHRELRRLHHDLDMTRHVSTSRKRKLEELEEKYGKISKRHP